MMTFEAVGARSRRQLGLLPLLALLHLGLWWGLDAAWRQNQSVPPDSPTRLAMRLLAPPLKKAAMPAQAVLPSVARRQARPSTAQALTHLPLPLPLPQAESVAPSPPNPPSPPFSTADSATPKPGLLINTEATRRAIHQATRAPLLSERAATAMGDGPPLDQAEKLGQEVRNAGNGDCLKGEFAGGGAGLLSLPFWLLAEARGKCAK